MAIANWMLDLIVKYGSGRGRVLSAGYPDVIVPLAMIGQMIGVERLAEVKRRPDTEAIHNWHKLAKNIPEFVDADSLFMAMGYEALDVLDIEKWRGSEIILDLNYPIPVGMHERYDLVIDPGTSEHCFHVGQSAINLASMVKVGGVILQVLPLQAWNHGFYAVQPTWFHSFYPENGFTIECCYAVQRSRPEDMPSVYSVPAHKRFMEAPQESYIGCVARRVERKTVGPVVQLKYKKKMSNVAKAD